ncbi:uncharacterized protein LOC143594472 [Bidens hawaiensis]|uniref:uncharacterized protein LOC143594472 n=1 Tax=Bidens hawaiensis TaxID=980011 RepID=UPI00404B58FD
MQDPIGIPACFSAGDKPEDSTTITKSGQSVFMSVYKTKIADQCRPGNRARVQSRVKAVELLAKTWVEKLCSRRNPLDIFWDQKSAKFHGETEPVSEYYVAVVSGDEVVLVLGDMKKDAYRKTGCRPALTDAVLVSNMFLGGFHDVLIECINRSNADLEMEIRIDGDLMVHVKHLQWKFRGNELIKFKKGFIEVYWDVHDWLFSPGLRHALFIIKPSALPPPVPPVLTSPASFCGSVQGLDSVCLYEFCLFLYAWKVE